MLWKNLLVLLICSLLAACGNDDKNIDNSKIKLNIKECTLDYPQTYALVKILEKGGEGRCTIKSINNNIARIIQGVKDDMFLIAMNKDIGNTTVFVTDEKGNTATIRISAPSIRYGIGTSKHIV